MINKIAVIGISGSGKSIFSRQFGAQTGLPVFHMDSIFWKGNWQEIPESQYLQKHERLVEQDKWIIERYIDKKMSNRLASADLVLYLDYSGIRCAWHLMVRWLKHRKESRPELPKEAKEVLSLRFIYLVLTRGERKNIEEAIQIARPLNLKRFSSPKELNIFIKNQR